MNACLRKLIGLNIGEQKVPGRGRPCTARTADNIATVEELVQSQQDKPQTHHTVCETAREIGIHRSSIHRIIRKHLACCQCRVCRYSNNDSLKCARKYCIYSSICSCHVQQHHSTLPPSSYYQTMCRNCFKFKQTSHK